MGEKFGKGAREGLERAAFVLGVDAPQAFVKLFGGLLTGVLFSRAEGRGSRCQEREGRRS